MTIYVAGKQTYQGVRGKHKLVILKTANIIIQLYCHTSYLYLVLFQELKPTMDELGILTPEEMGYDKPELALPNPFEIHG